MSAQIYFGYLRTKLETMRFLLTALLIFQTIVLVAQPAPPSSLHLADLRVWLKANWYDSYFTDLGYSPARIQMYGYTDEVGGNIACIYTGYEQAASFVTFPDPINAEHIVPQSFFGSASPMRSDIYNLRPAHGSANSARSNNPFGECDDAQSTWYGIDGQGNYISQTSIPNPNVNFSERVGTLWEPREDKKGDLARQLFYFYTMYPTEAGPFSNIGDITIFYQWHLQDPVDASELTRSTRVSEVQGNENPYILFPNLVYEAWFWVASPGCTDPLAINYDPAATVDDGTCIYGPIPGCTYAAANNYNSNATVDDGSCLFDTGVLGCTYSEATNFNPTATVDDGSCVYDSGILGCTYLEATNYNSNATIDDGSCVYDSGIEGCTYIEATNYDANATVDDGSCFFDPGILGCTYISATNYNSTATVDDGTCIFELLQTCAEDLNNDGTVDVTDFLLLLSAFGSNCN
jgi:hypothetical protein